MLKKIINNRQLISKSAALMRTGVAAPMFIP